MRKKKKSNEKSKLQPKRYRGRDKLKEKKKKEDTGGYACVRLSSRIEYERRRGKERRGHPSLSLPPSAQGKTEDRRHE